MADWFFGLNRGIVRDVPDANVTAGTSTGSTDVELRVAQGASLTKKDVDTLTEAIQRYVSSGHNTLGPKL